MTDHETRTEAEAHVSLIHAIAHYGQFPTPENHRVYADCIDAYAEAVRAAERARLAARVRDLDAMYLSGLYRVRKVDVLRLLTEDTAREFRRVSMLPFDTDDAAQ